MKKAIFSIIAIAMSYMAAYSQNKVYVCEGFDYDELKIASLGDITFSADGTEVNIGEENVYQVADIDSITFHEPQFPKVRVVYNETSATVSVPASYKGITYSVNGADVVINSTTRQRNICIALKEVPKTVLSRSTATTSSRLNWLGSV